jgi:hypothetical protein
VSALEVLVRLIVIGGSAGINLDGHLSTWISGSLGLVAMVATAELAVRPYGAKVFDRLLLIAGSLVVTLILLGVVLNVAPWGLTRGTWNAAWLVLSILVLFWRRGIRTRVILPGRFINVVSLSIVVAAAIIVGAGVLAINGVKKWDEKSILSFSLVSSSSTNITTEINATSVRGSYSIVAFSQTHKKSHYMSKPFSVSAGSSGETVQEQVPVKVRGPWVINLESAGKVVRELIVDV